MELVSFRNKETGVILTPQNEWAKSQLAKNEEFEVVSGNKNTSNTSTKTKAIKDYTKKELVEFLTEKGIECNEEMKKEELLLLVPEE